MTALILASFAATLAGYAIGALGLALCLALIRVLFTEREN